MRFPSRRVSTRCAKRSLARCCDTAGAATPTCSASSPTECSPCRSAHMMCSRVRSARNLNVAVAASSCSPVGSSPICALTQIDYQRAADAPSLAAARRWCWPQVVSSSSPSPIHPGSAELWQQGVSGSGRSRSTSVARRSSEHLADDGNDADDGQNDYGKDDDQGPSHDADDHGALPSSVQRATRAAPSSEVRSALLALGVGWAYATSL